MKPIFFIAKRYLFARKSHNVINIISIISAAGIAIGCSALIVILSIYNGFDSLVKSLYETDSADLVITPVKGKVFTPSGKEFDEIRKDASIICFSEILEENVFVQYGDRQVVALAKGIDSLYEKMTGLGGYIIEGAFDLKYGSVNQAVLGRIIAQELGVSTKFITPLEIYFPSRKKEVSILNPMASLREEKIFPSGIVAIDQNFDKKYIFVPIEVLRSLLEYENQVSKVALKVSPDFVGKDHSISSEFQRKIEKAVGKEYSVKNRFQQNESMYKILTYEKLAIYSILLFVVLIISCNVFGSLSMLVIEKKDDMDILRSMGADDKMIRKIFVTEGWMISLLGIITGIVIGLVICVLQQRYGFVKMPGNFIIESYPVVVRWTDVVITVVAVGTIGYLIAEIPFIRKK